MNEMYKRIEALCKQRNINITKLCKDAGIPRGNLTDLKMGRTVALSTKSLQKISTYFGIRMDYLLGTEPEPLLTLDLGNSELSSGPEAEKAPAPLPEDEREAEFLKLFRELSEAEQERELAFLRERAGGKNT